MGHGTKNPRTSALLITCKIKIYDFPTNTFNLVTAQFALPFNKPGTFDEVLTKIKMSLKPEGVFEGHFFGLHDEWNTPGSGMSFHSRQDIEHMFSDTQLHKLEEKESDKETAGGVMKHGHVFEVIAVK